MSEDEYQKPLKPGRKHGKHIPGPIRDGVLRELAAKPSPLPKGEIDKIAKRWHCSHAAVSKMTTRNSEELNALRAMIAERNLLIAGKVQDHLMDKLDAKCVDASIKDLAFANKAASDAAVSLLEGHERPVGIVNFGELKKTIKALATYREAKIIPV